MSRIPLRKISGRIWVSGIAGLLLGLNNGCHMFSKDEDTDEPKDHFAFIQKQDAKSYTERTTSVQDMIIPEDELFSEEIQKEAEKLSQGYAASPPKTARLQKRAPFYEDFIVLDADERIEVMLTFNAAPLVDALPAFADVLGFNFTADSDIKNLITLNINSTMTRRELWETMEETLKVAGVGVMKNGQFLQFVPAAKMPAGSGLNRYGNRFNANYDIISYALKSANAKETAAQLKPFLSKEGAIIELTRQNVLVISDNSSNTAKLMEILEAVDQPGRVNWPRAVIYCRNVKPSKISTELSNILPMLGLPVVLSTDRAEEPGAVRLSSIDRLQLIAATAATEEAVEEIKKWIHILDNAESSDQERAYIYKVANGKAEELVQALSVIFTTQGSTLTVDTASGDNRTQQLTTQTTRTPTTPGTTATDRNSTNAMLNTQIDRASGVFDNPVRIFADGVHNRLVIRTTPRTYATIKALLDRLDVVPAQVLMQVLIVEITLGKGTEFGVEFNNKSVGNHLGTSVGTNYNNMTAGEDEAPKEGFSLGLFNPSNPEEKFGFLRALAERQNVSLISSPQLVVTSNTEAEIRVGEQVPLLQSDITNTSSAGSMSRSYTYKETGIIMKVTPQVTSTDLISLQLDQTVSEAIQNKITNATETPVIKERVLKTAMTVSNGKTMVIGGIIQERKENNLKSIPLIADIPFIGELLGDSILSAKRTEMLVLITCYIVNERSQIKDMISRYNDAVKALSVFEESLEERKLESAVKVDVIKKLDPVISANNDAE